MPVTRVALIAALALDGVSLGGLAPSAQPVVSFANVAARAALARATQLNPGLAAPDVANSLRDPGAMSACHGAPNGCIKLLP